MSERSALEIAGNFADALLRNQEELIVLQKAINKIAAQYWHVLEEVLSTEEIEAICKKIR